jgi:cyclic pyranopterin phosphate synthase
MLKDNCGRKITYARISLTDECELKCRYCRPDNIVSKYNKDNVLSYDEVDTLIKMLVETGITKFRFTGGEPFIREGIMGFLSNVNLDEFCVTTCLSSKLLDINGINKLNLKNINVSLDTLDPEKYKWLTRVGDLKTVKENLRNIRVPSLGLNTVVIKDFNDSEIMDIIEFACSIGATPRFIEKMDFSENMLRFYSLNELRARLIKERIIKPESYTYENSVAVYHDIRGTQNKVGFIMPASEPFCSTCNRIRIKADGSLKLCLFDNSSINLKQMIRHGSIDDFKLAIRKVVLNKPVCSGAGRSEESMVSIGG